MSNTKDGFALRFLIYKEPDEKFFTGVCYELSIVLTDKNLERLKRRLTATAHDYAQTVINEGFPDKLLDQSNKLDPKYAVLFKKFDDLYNINRKSATSEEIEEVADLSAVAFIEPIPAYA